MNFSCDVFRPLYFTLNYTIMPRGKKGGRGRGGGRGGRGGRKGGGGGGGNTWNNAPRQSYAEVKKENKQLENYYNTLNIVPEGEEREQFWAALRRELPNSFRFCGSKGYVSKSLGSSFVTRS